MPPLRPLALAVKTLLHEHHLGDPYLGGISSYAVVLMLVYFFFTKGKKQQQVSQLSLLDSLKTSSSTSLKSINLPMTSGGGVEGITPRQSPRQSPRSSPGPFARMVNTSSSVTTSSVNHIFTSESISSPTLMNHQSTSPMDPLFQQKLSSSLSLMYGHVRKRSQSGSSDLSETSVVSSSSATSQPPPPPPSSVVDWPPLTTAHESSSPNHSKSPISSSRKQMIGRASIQANNGIDELMKHSKDSNDSGMDSIDTSAPVLPSSTKQKYEWRPPKPWAPPPSRHGNVSIAHTYVPMTPQTGDKKAYGYSRGTGVGGTGGGVSGGNHSKLQHDRSWMKQRQLSDLKEEAGCPDLPLQHKTTTTHPSEGNATSIAAGTSLIPQSMSGITPPPPARVTDPVMVGRHKARVILLHGRRVLQQRARCLFAANNGNSGISQPYSSVQASNDSTSHIQDHEPSIQAHDDVLPARMSLHDLRRECSTEASISDAIAQSLETFSMRDTHITDFASLYSNIGDSSGLNNNSSSNSNTNNSNSNSGGSNRIGGSGSVCRSNEDLGIMLLEFLKFWGEDFKAGQEGFSLRRGGFRFSVNAQEEEEEEVVALSSTSKCTSRGRGGGGGDGSNSIRRNVIGIPGIGVGGAPRHPQASDPVVIEDPINVISNVGRSSYKFNQVQKLFSNSQTLLLKHIILFEQDDPDSEETTRILETTLGEVNETKFTEYPLLRHILKQQP